MPELLPEQISTNLHWFNTSAGSFEENFICSYEIYTF
jgi:hypothetical protein